MRILAAVAVATLLVLLVVVLRGTLDAPEALTDPGRALAADLSTAPLHSEVRATATPVSEHRRAVEASSPEDVPPEAWGDAAESGRIDALLAQLRRLARGESFHEEAWPIVEELADAIPHEEGGAGRVEEVVRDSAAEPDPVRAACLLSLSRALPEEELRSIALPLRRDRSPEVERAAWLALSAAHDGEDGLRIELLAFESYTQLVTFPLTSSTVARPEDVSEALDRLTREVSARFGDADGGRDPAVREETFTRELIVLAVLGPSAGRPGTVRERLLSWVESTGLPTNVVRQVSMHCLALAARHDPELAEQLARTAQQQSTELDGGTLLQLFVQGSGRSDLVLDTLREILARPGDDTDLLAKVEALVALTAAIENGDADASFAATQLLVERALDPNTEEFERDLILNRLASTRSEVLFDVARLAFESETDPDALRKIVTYLGLVEPSSHGKACELLIHSYDPSGNLELQKNILRALSRLSVAESKDFLSHVASTEVHAELSAYADSLLE